MGMATMVVDGRASTPWQSLPRKKQEPADRKTNQPRFCFFLLSPAGVSMFYHRLTLLFALPSSPHSPAVFNRIHHQTTTMQTDIILSDHELDEIFAADSYNVRISLKPIEDSTSPNSSAPSSPVTTEAIPLPDGVVPMRCGYRTGKCENLQAVKRNGKLHKLCEFHRDKANQNQKKLDRKKRLMRYLPYDGHASSDDESTSSLQSFEASPRSIDFHHFEAYAPHPTSLYEAPLALGGEELEIFYSIMTFDIDQRAAHAYTRPHQAVYHHHHTQYTIV